MGGKQSQPVASGGGDCKPCFLFSPGRAALDPIGSPVPDTPLLVRQRRQGVKDAIGREKNPLYSSRYEGLEEEPSASYTVRSDASAGFLKPPEVEVEATVYEGIDCEQKLAAKYDLLEVLGVGSTSTVHRCVSKATGAEFACKVIDCQLIEERFQGMMGQFQTEIESLRQLKHPGIIRLYDVFIKSNEKIYIVMELMDGGELFDYVVEKGTLTEEEAAQIVRKVLSAVRCAIRSSSARDSSASL